VAGDISNLANRLLTTDANKPVAGHFLGTVVLEQTPNRTGSIACREVIDGQQRLTTLQILLKATQHALTEIEESATEDNDGTTQKAARVAARQIEALTSNPAYAEDEEKYKVWPTNEDREAFREVMDAADPSEIVAASTRMAEAYRFFLSSIREWFEKGELGSRASALTSALKDHVRLRPR
jgi:Protein of unknown function DUF262